MFERTFFSRFASLWRCCNIQHEYELEIKHCNDRIYSIICFIIICLNLEIKTNEAVGSHEDFQFRRDMVTKCNAKCLKQIFDQILFSIQSTMCVFMYSMYFMYTLSFKYIPHYLIFEIYHETLLSFYYNCNCLGGCVLTSNSFYWQLFLTIIAVLFLYTPPNGWPLQHPSALN